MSPADPVTNAIFIAIMLFVAIYLFKKYYKPCTSIGQSKGKKIDTSMPYTQKRRTGQVNQYIAFA
ncbi:hypothetical protein GCM10028806_48600 [Spirosoma terrae]